MSTYELLLHCSPTLANLKTGNLFAVSYPSFQELNTRVGDKNAQLNPKGVYISLLRVGNGRALVYVYRKSRLLERLNSEPVQKFLMKQGYTDFSLEGSLNFLKECLKNSDFPHEIGVFLGYPLEDIKGFVKHKGRNFHCSGFWKVYHNPENAQKLFSQYKKCSKVYLECYKNGTDMSQLTVAG